MSLTRRAFLETGLALGAVSCASNPSPLAAPRSPDPVSARFVHGVASGDPGSDRVILWTRVSGIETLTDVRWFVARDEGLRDGVRSGTAVAHPDSDFTVKVDAQGLEPGQTYYYAFEVGAVRSPVGRTKTLPIGEVERVRFAIASCSNYAFGYFNGYAAIARRDDIDAVLHLGDYIYEVRNGTYGDGTALGRVPVPDKEIVTLDDYRQRHAQYRSDPDLQEAHRRHPFIAVWDDHESANDAWKGGAANHQPEEEGPWAERRAAAVRAYLEWLPVRDAPTIWRRFRYGRLVDLFMLDTRLHGRDQQIADRSAPELDDPGRTILGEDQRRWLVEGLQASAEEGVAWRAIGQQVMMAQIRRDDEQPWSTDMWDGYDPSRRRVLESFETIPDVVVFTGDVHSSWASELAVDPFDSQRYDPRTSEGAVAVEFTTPAITSSPPNVGPSPAEIEQHLLASHPHVRWVDLRHRGYLLVDFTSERAEARWYHLETIEDRRPDERLAQTLRVPRGRAHLEQG